MATNPIDLAALRKLWAEIGPDPLQLYGRDVIRPSGDAELGNWKVASFRWDGEATSFIAIHAAFPALADELEAARKELAIARQSPAEYLDKLGADWLVDNEARLKAEGAAESMEKAQTILAMAESGEEAYEMLGKEVARLREKGR